MGKRFVIQPNWLPMDTAPKTGETIVVVAASAGFDKDVINTSYRKVRWGHMEHYPDLEPVWLVDGSDNSYIDEQEWTKERHLFVEYGQEREINIYRGLSLIAWAYPWEVEVQLPEVHLPFRQTKIFDSRAK